MMKKKTQINKRIIFPPTTGPIDVTRQLFLLNLGKQLNKVLSFTL